MEWISFKNRRPKRASEHGKRLLLCNAKTHIIDTGKFMHDPGDRRIEGNPADIDRRLFTHWMLFPDLPQTSSSTWTSIKDAKLPHMHSIILYNTNTQTVDLGLYTKDEEGEFLEGANCEGIDFRSLFTHWMIFPEPPKKIDKAK